MNYERPIKKPERQKLPLDPNGFLGALESHPMYLELTSQGKSHTEAICSAAKLEYERSPDGPHSLPLRLLAITPSFETAQTRLNAMRERQAPASETLPVKKEVIAFNHHLRDIIDHNPRMPVNELLQFTESSTLSLSGPEIARKTRHDVEQALQGMRHELAFESLLYYLVEDDVMYDESDKSSEQLIAEELRGIDMVVEYKNQPIAIDVKATQNSADTAQTNNELYGRSKIALWSQFETRELGPKLLPGYNQTSIEQKSSAVLIELEQAYQNGNLYQDPSLKRSRHLGRQAMHGTR